MISKISVGQKHWTLDNCIQYAINHNLEIRKNIYNKDSQEETYKQSYRSLLPTITAYSDYGIRYGRSVDPFDNSISNTRFFQNNYSLEASIDLFDGFQKMNTIKASKLLYKVVEEETLQPVSYTHLTLPTTSRV